MSKVHVLEADTLLDKNGKAVPAGDPTGISWLGVAGSSITVELAEQVGLVRKPAPAKKPTKKKET